MRESKGWRSNASSTHFISSAKTDAIGWQDSGLRMSISGFNLHVNEPVKKDIAKESMCRSRFESNLFNRK